MKIYRHQGLILGAILLVACESDLSRLPVRGNPYTIVYDNSQGLMEDSIRVVYVFDFWGNTGNNYQGARGLFQNVLHPDSGRTTELLMDRVDDKWVAALTIPRDVSLISYYFTDGTTYDYNSKQTFSSYVYDEKGKPVEGARFRNLDFMIMAEKSEAEILQEVREEFQAYPSNWIAYKVYFRKMFEGVKTFEDIDNSRDQADKIIKRLTEAYGETDEIALIQAEYLANYIYSFYTPMMEPQDAAREELYALMDALPPEKITGRAKIIYDSRKRIIEQSQRQSGLIEHIDKLAPDFSYTTIEGIPGKLSDLQGQYILLDFWGTWCKPCVAEIPNLKEAFQAYRDKGFMILSISSDTFEKEDLEAFAQEHGMDWTHILDGRQGPIQKLYKINSYPSLLLIAPDGKVLAINYDLRGNSLLKKLEEVYAE